ncbi:MAG: hypothetical protein ABIF88_01195 [archaeon]
MKKLMILVVLVFSVCLFWFVSSQGQGAGGDSGNGLGNDDEGNGMIVNAVGGTHINSAGEEMKIQVQANNQNMNQFRLEVGGVSSTCDECEMYQEKVAEKTMLYAKLSNGEKKEIKIMPDVASTKAIEALRLHNCVEPDCIIEFKEVGEGNQARFAYNIQAKKQARFLGIFPTEVDAEAVIDVETGETISTKKSWWAFLANE